MRILVACKESQAVTRELRRLGHEAYSCDVVPPSGGHPEWHITGDVLPHLEGFGRFRTSDGSWHGIERERENNRFIVMLLPARTDTKWFQQYVLPYAWLWFVDGRLKFGGAETSAPFPSVVAVYVKRH